MKTLNTNQIKKYVLDNPNYFEFMPQEIRGRLNTNEQLSIAQIQKKIIEEVYAPLTQEEIDKITPATQKAESELYDILHKMGIVISEPINWIIIKSKDGFNWNLSFTQGNVIILSQKSIDKDNNLARTLAHEMIHIYQRKHPQLFRNYYKKKFGFDDFKPNQKQLDSIDDLGIDKIYIDNPDNCRMGLMIFKNKYLPISVILTNEKKPVNIVLEMTEDSVILDLEKKHQMNSYDKVRLDQPNEVFAYMVTKNIK